MKTAGKSTIIVVTHDPARALRLGDQPLVMDYGRIAPLSKLSCPRAGFSPVQAPNIGGPGTISPNPLGLSGRNLGADLHQSLYLAVPLWLPVVPGPGPAPGGGRRPRRPGLGLAAGGAWAPGRSLPPGLG